MRAAWKELERKYAEYYRMQAEIASLAIWEDCISLEKLSLVGGADQAFILENENEKIISAVVVLAYPSLEVVERAFAVLPVNFPYIPGLLAFREAPAIAEAFKRLRRKPEVLFVDGCGVNHPRFAGLATHVGVSLDVATIGVAKKLLCGRGEIPEKEGEATEIRFRGRVVGFFLKSKQGCRPIIVAPGHKISLSTALELTKRCIRKHKLPEPTRIAHNYANEIKKRFKNGSNSSNNSNNSNNRNSNDSREGREGRDSRNSSDTARGSSQANLQRFRR
ncbi:MAG: endonuclease V [Candidatus Methanospirare jalkutatii]|nr:MAG: endonuclease V [Candidatus Methanospirare jalkutatii]